MCTVIAAMNRMRRPVVDLAHQQAAADVERRRQRRGEGLGHRQALHQLVAAVVLDLGHRRLEPDGQEHAGEQQHDEAVQRDLAEQERPVVGEDLAQAALGDLREADAFVQPGADAGELADAPTARPVGAACRGRARRR